jgi:hypothetical protein
MGSYNVVLGKLERIVKGILDMGLCRKMNNVRDLMFLQYFLHQCHVGQIALHQAILGAGAVSYFFVYIGFVRAIIHGIKIDNVVLIRFVNEIHKIGPNESTPARHQQVFFARYCFHCFIIV